VDNNWKEILSLSIHYLQKYHLNYKVFTLACLLCFSPISQAKDEIRIGILAVWGTTLTKNQWQPTIDHLNRQIKEYQFKLVPLSLPESFAAVQNQDIDFILTNPGNYIELESSHGISRIATLRRLRQGVPSTQFGAVIFSRADQSKIKKLEHLRGKRFMAVAENAFGGFQMAWRELKKIDIDPFTDFSQLKFSGFPQDKIVHAVINKDVDAGTVRTDTLERMFREGKLKPEDIRILNPKETENFPFLHSTQLYPEWPIATLRHTPLKLAKKVTIALLNIQETSKEARASKSAGWTVPLDYYLVRDLMQELEIGPYKPLSQKTGGSI